MKVHPLVSGSRRAERNARRVRVLRWAELLRSGYSVAAIARLESLDYNEVYMPMQNACPAFLPQPRVVVREVERVVIEERIVEVPVYVSPLPIIDDTPRPDWSYPGQWLLDEVRAARAEMEGVG